MPYSGSQAAATPAIITIGSNVFILPTPDINLPTPTINMVTTNATQLHSISAFNDTALIADGFAGGSDPSAYVLQLSTGVIDAINHRDFTGSVLSIAISPLQTHALAADRSSRIAVIHAPFNAASDITEVDRRPISISQSTAEIPTAEYIASHSAIIFDTKGRAFVHELGGILVIDPPYERVAFVITLPKYNGWNYTGQIAITPDNNTLLITPAYSDAINPEHPDSPILIFNAPFSANSTPTYLKTYVQYPASLNRIAITPDGNVALASFYKFPARKKEPFLLAIHAPYTAESIMEEIPLPNGVISAETSIDIDIDPTGNLAILTSMYDSEVKKALFIKAPFNANEATIFEVQIPDTQTPSPIYGSVRFSRAVSLLSAALNITKTGPLTIDPNGQITYTLTYGNTGQADAANVAIQDSLPANTSFVSASHNGAFNGSEVVWNMGTVGMGVDNQTVQFTVQANAAPGAAIVNNTYSIAADGVPAVAGSVPVTTTVNQAQAVQPVPTLNQGMILLCTILLFGIAALRLRQA